MQEVVDVPRLVPDHQVVVLVADQLVEHHEVVDQDRIHPADGLEGVQVVLVGLVVDVGHLAGQPPGRRVHVLAGGLEHPRHRGLGQPVDLQVLVADAQLVRDRHVPSGVAQADG